ncbi:MAG: DUF4115 domain-containing protein [Proteobacteria bacterium]|nr:DUF4115 domain-containing protein [Pseudomonadota bacterium]
MTDENTTRALPGERLRRQREHRGLTLAQVSSELHVSQRMLAALEADDFEALGAPIFVKGHLRSYARLIGLDPAELIAEYEAAQRPDEPALVAHKPDGPRMDQHRSHAWVGWFGWVFLLLLGLLLAGWWYYQQEGGADFVISNTPERTEFPTQSQQQPRQSSAQPPAETGISEEDASQATEPTGNDPAETGDEDGAQEPVPTDESTSNAEPAVSPQLTAPASPPAAGRGLVLEFEEESWVEIYDSEGRPILYDLLAAGTRREINATGQLRIFLGNATGVEVTVGGEEFDLQRYRRDDDTARFTVNIPAARN